MPSHWLHTESNIKKKYTIHMELAYFAFSFIPFKWQRCFFFFFQYLLGCKHVYLPWGLLTKCCQQKLIEVVSSASWLPEMEKNKNKKRRGRRRRKWRRRKINWRIRRTRREHSQLLLKRKQIYGSASLNSIYKVWVWGINRLLAKI